MRSSITKPPWSIRLWAMNWRMKSATAGPGQATHPSPIRKRRWRSRGSSASRSWSWRTKSSRWRRSLTGSSRRNPVRLIHAGTVGPAEDLGERPGRGLRDLLGNPQRQRDPRVDRAAEGDHRVDPVAAAEGGRLVTEHAPLRVAAEVDVGAGRPADQVDRLGDGDDVVGEVALEPTLLALGGAEVDHPGVGALAVQDRDRARRRRDVVDVGREHQRRHQQHRRPGRLAGVVVAQPEDRASRGDLERRRLLVGLEAAEARDLERVLRRGSQSRRRAQDGIRDQADDGKTTAHPRECRRIGPLRWPWRASRRRPGPAPPRTRARGARGRRPDRRGRRRRCA